MAESIYACLFSTGLVKVGRSIDPVSRMATHEERVSCTGAEMIKTFHMECSVASQVSEVELIRRCDESCTKRFKSEWFDGLDFDVVVLWVEQISRGDFKQVEISNNADALKSFFMALSVSQRDLFSERCGTSRQHLTNIAYGLKPCGVSLAINIERESLGRVRCEVLCPNGADWAFIRQTKKAA